MTIDCTLKFDHNNGEVVFIDSVGEDHDSVDQAIGIIRVSRDGVVMYENEGWDTASFLNPDTYKDNWSVKLFDFDPDEMIELMESSAILVEYKLSNNGTGNTVTEVSELINITHEDPVPEVSIDTDYSAGKITVSDITEYGSNIANLDETRSLSLKYPEGSGLNTVYSNTDTLDGLMTGTYGSVEAELLSYPKYRFSGDMIDIVLETSINGLTSEYIADNPLVINPFNCLSKLARKYEAALNSSKESALTLEESLKELTWYSLMYDYSVGANLSYTYFMNRIHEITSDCECSLVDYNGKGDNDSTVEKNVYEYLTMQLKEYYEQRNTNNPIADQRLSVINMIITWYTIYSLASTEDKVIPLQKINFYLGGYESDSEETIEDTTDYSSCISSYIDCVNRQSELYESNKLENTTLVFDSSRRLSDMVNFFQLFLLGGYSEMDKTYACDIMRELMFACGCSDGSGTGGGETPPSEENPFILWGNVPDKDAVTIEDIESLADKEQRSDRFGIITDLDGGGNYPCIVMPTSFSSEGLFKYNNYTYEFVKVDTLSYTDENENTYDVDVFVWRTQNYGVWNQVIPL